MMWTWRAEKADEWSYQAGLQYGWIPKNPTDREYPDICDEYLSRRVQHSSSGQLPL
jgi:hypothetical protein